METEQNKLQAKLNFLQYSHNFFHDNYISYAATQRKTSTWILLGWLMYTAYTS